MRLKRGTEKNRGQFTSGRPEKCELPGECTLAEPRCDACREGRALYLEEVPDGDWSRLEYWQRDAWRETAKLARQGG